MSTSNEHNWRIAGLVAFVIAIALFSLVDFQVRMRGLGASMMMGANLPASEFLERESL